MSIFFKKKIRKVLSLKHKEDSKDLKSHSNPFEYFSYGNLNGKDYPIIITTGVGRSGTHFFAELFNSHPKIEALHLDSIRNSIADSFLDVHKMV